MQRATNTIAAVCHVVPACYAALHVTGTQCWPMKHVKSYHVAGLGAGLLAWTLDPAHSGMSPVTYIRCGLDR